MRGRPAFSLVELLVVVGICAVLIGLSIGGLSLARQRARVVACQNRLRQVGIGLANYAQRWDGAIFPPRRGAELLLAERWPAHVFDGADQAVVPFLRCPTWERDEISYLLNHHLVDLKMRVTSRSTKGVGQCQVVVSGEKRPEDIAREHLYMNHGEYEAVVDERRHGRYGSNLLFLDWHVEALTALPLSFRRADPWDPGMSFYRP